jgi:hypothetical protein
MQSAQPHPLTTTTTTTTATPLIVSKSQFSGLISKNISDILNNKPKITNKQRRTHTPCRLAICNEVSKRAIGQSLKRSKNRKFF